MADGHRASSRVGTAPQPNSHPGQRRVLPARGWTPEKRIGQEWGTHRFHCRPERSGRLGVKPPTGGGAPSSSNPTAHLTGVGKDFAMPAIRRMTRSGALSLISLGLAATGSLGVSLAATPAQAADRDAVALDEGQFAKYQQKDAARKKAAARKMTTKLRTAQSIALNQRGEAYVYGAAGPNAFDCSGLIYYSYRKAGLSVPRTSSAQAAATRRVAKHEHAPRRPDVLLQLGRRLPRGDLPPLGARSSHDGELTQLGSQRDRVGPLDEQLVRRHPALTRRGRAARPRAVRHTPSDLLCGAPSPPGWGRRATLGGERPAPPTDRSPPCFPACPAA